MKFLLKITPSINPKTRHRIEDVLISEGYSIIGGGQTTRHCDESFLDITFERDDPRDREG